MKQNIGKKFTAMLIAYYAMFAIGPAFYVVILEQKGVPQGSIGLYTALIALLAGVMQPVYGFLCDKTCKAKQILIATNFIAVGAYAVLVVVNGTVALVLCSLVIGACLNAMYGFSESWLSKLGCEQNGVNFGAVRSFGSLSYAITAALYGFVYDQFGMLSVPVCMAVCVAAMAATALLCPNPQPVQVLQDEPKVRFADALQSLLKNRPYVLMVLCYALAAIPTGAMLSYFPVHLKNLGGTASSVGVALFVLAGSEFFSMQWYKKLEAKFSCTKLLAFAFLMYAVKNALIALAPSVGLAIAASATQGLCYGLVVPATQSFVTTHVSRKYTATAQLVCNTGGMMLSQLPGALLGGLLVGYMSAGNMLLCMSSFAVLSFFVFVAGMKRYRML